MRTTSQRADVMDQPLARVGLSNPFNVESWGNVALCKVQRRPDSLQASKIDFDAKKRSVHCPSCS